MNDWFNRVNCYVSKPGKNIARNILIGKAQMKNEPVEKFNNKNQGSKIGVGIAIGLAIGTGLGMALGLAYGNLALGIPIGVGAGLSIGIAIGTALDQGQNKNEKY